MDVLKKAQQRIEILKSSVHSLRLQRETIEAQISQQEHEMARLSGFVDTYRELDEVVEGGSVAIQYEERIRRFRSLLSPRNIEVIVEAYLKVAAPKRTGELVAYLQEKGCQIPSDRKETYVAGVLSRSNRFVARRKLGGWFLVDNDPQSKSNNLFDGSSEENMQSKSETPSVGAEGVFDTSTQATVGGGYESDNLV